MIAYIKGKILLRGEKYIILETNGIGYKIFVMPEDIKNTKKESEASFWTHLHVREDAMEIYGFLEYSEVELFEMLINISGIGPKSALGVLSLAPVDTLKRAISSEDTSYLTKVSGIGRKIAEKIVLELKDKLGSRKIDGITDPELKEEGDVLQALQSLGYSLREAREALKQVPNNIEGANNRIKEALKRI
jgi:Holliday junction DNA helicase RuvA